MRVKALVDFGGQYAMLKGSECDLPEDPVTRVLIEEGYLVKIEEPQETAPEEEAEKTESPKPDLSELTKNELLKMCAEKGITPDKKAKKEDLIAALEAQE